MRLRSTSSDPTVQSKLFRGELKVWYSKFRDESLDTNTTNGFIHNNNRGTIEGEDFIDLAGSLAKGYLSLQVTSTAGVTDQVVISEFDFIRRAALFIVNSNARIHMRWWY